ncbi:hypothetical protein LTR08_000103 [Meristemomyces frigidus]|nr:hypothetical protein LTR08_000103 [Meristemomyces frigidus]
MAYFPPITASLPPITGPVTAASSILGIFTNKASGSNLIFLQQPTTTLKEPPAVTIGPLGYPPTTLLPTNVNDPHFYDDMHARAPRAGVMPYAVLFFVWTIVVAGGLVTIWTTRGKKATKIRDWRAITIAVLAIHLLFMICLVASWIPKQFNCKVVFWMVSLMIPACLAAFQVPNARLVSYYIANKNSGMSQKLPVRNEPKWRSWSLWCRWNRMTILEKTYFTVSVGLVLQFLFTTLMFFGSRRFHATYGLWGRKEDSAKCMFGFEWVVSVVWQMIWAYGTGFFLLREIRHVKDVYHWGLETRIAIFVSMPGPLLWMIFMFTNTHAVRVVNSQWPPRNWLIPGLAIVQFVLLAFPIWDACKVDAKVEASKTRNSTYGLGSSLDHMISTIDSNSEPLVNFAASTKFNAELIIFLRDVKKWRETWTSPGADWAVPSDVEKRVACYKHAALLYFKLVDTSTAEFAINIDNKMRTAMAEEFRYARYISRGRPSMGRRLSITPWGSPADGTANIISCRSSPLSMTGLEITLAEAEESIMLVIPEMHDATEDDGEDSTTKGINMTDYAQLDAPDTFTLTVFEEAYKSVKQEAYYNTWLPYHQSGKYKEDFKSSEDMA